MLPVVALLEGLQSRCSSRSRSRSSDRHAYIEIPGEDRGVEGRGEGAEGTADREGGAAGDRGDGRSVCTVTPVRVGLVLVSTFVAVNVPCFGLVNTCV